VLGIASPGFVAVMLTLLMLAAPLALAAYGWRRAGRHDQAAQAALDHAWTEVAAALSQGRSEPLTARELAKLMSIDEAQAELLLAQVSVDQMMHARVEPIAERKRFETADTVLLERAAEEEAAEQDALQAAESQAPAKRERR
jgi:hypothetical protein